MVEGAVVFPVMAMFLVMLELAHHSVDGYITAAHISRERAWSSATTGSIIGQCPKNGRDDDLYSSKVKYFKIEGAGNSDSPNAGAAQSPDTGGQVSVPGGTPGQNGFFKHTQDTTADVSVARGGRSFENKQTAKDTVYCNQGWYGSLIDIIKSAFKH